MQTLGSQRLFQIAVKERPELLLRSLRRSGAVGRREKLRWGSPLAQDGFKEYRDTAALKRLGIASSLTVPLQDFWPRRGQVWDGLAVAGEDRPILVEAKAHIPETVSGGSHASAGVAQIDRAIAQTNAETPRPTKHGSVERPFLPVRQPTCIPVLPPRAERRREQPGFFSTSPTP